MTLRMEANQMKKRRASNLSLLAEKINLTIQRLRNLKRLERKNKQFGLSDALEVVDGQTAFEALTEENLEEKLAAV